MPPVDGDESRVHCRLDELLKERGMTLTDLSRQVGVSIVNLSVLKNDRARAIRFSTLTAICEALGCQVGDLLVIDPDPAESASPIATPSTPSTPSAVRIRPPSA
jgi:putative transcriptional regulator